MDRAHPGRELLQGRGDAGDHEADRWPVGGGRAALPVQQTQLRGGVERHPEHRAGMDSQVVAEREGGQHLPRVGGVRPPAGQQLPAGRSGRRRAVDLQGQRAGGPAAAAARSRRGLGQGELVGGHHPGQPGHHPGCRLQRESGHVRAVRGDELRQRGLRAAGRGRAGQHRSPGDADQRRDREPGTPPAAGPGRDDEPDHAHGVPSSAPSAARSPVITILPNARAGWQGANLPDPWVPARLCSSCRSLRAAIRAAFPPRSHRRSFVAPASLVRKTAPRPSASWRARRRRGDRPARARAGSNAQDAHPSPLSGGPRCRGVVAAQRFCSAEGIRFSIRPGIGVQRITASGIRRLCSRP